jgi:Family of unknown function (DUF5989)
MQFIFEFYRFLSQRKKLFLFPLVLIIILFGGLLLALQGAIFAPFLYAFF